MSNVHNAPDVATSSDAQLACASHAVVDRFADPESPQSQIVSATAGRSSTNARFSPLAKMLIVQPCDGVAEKVSRLQASGNDGPGLAERGCRDFSRTAHASVYYKHCTDEIMAKALKLPTAVAGRKGTAPCQGSSMAMDGYIHTIRDQDLTGPA